MTLLVNRSYNDPCDELGIIRRHTRQIGRSHNEGGFGFERLYLLRTFIE
jgi:hypothetical protein